MWCNNMNEKENIEQSTIKVFLSIFNKEYKKHFERFKHSDAPDFICKDETTNNILNIEITLTQDKVDDIPLLIGHKNDIRDIPEEKVKKMKSGELHYFDAVTVFGTDTLPMFYKTIEKKIQKAYGKGVMLVVRDTSPLDWDYTPYLDTIRNSY